MLGKIEFKTQIIISEDEANFKMIKNNPNIV